MLLWMTRVLRVRDCSRRFRLGQISSASQSLLLSPAASIPRRLGSWVALPCSQAVFDQNRLLRNLTSDSQFVLTTFFFHSGTRSQEITGFSKAVFRTDVPVFQGTACVPHCSLCMHRHSDLVVQCQPRSSRKAGTITVKTIDVPVFQGTARVPHCSLCMHRHSHLVVQCRPRSSRKSR